VATPLLDLEAELADLKRRDLLREPPTPLPPDAVSFCSNDYLGLAALPPPMAPAGAGASRLIAGERAEHRALEQAVAAWLGQEDALAFTSGYAANVGTLAALAGPGDLIVSDALNHASLIDGARLSRARVGIVPHLDLGAVDEALRERGSGRA
jgi:8-amino-7-oxononanoate synthase